MAGKHTAGPWSVSSTPISADQPFVSIYGGDGAGISYMTLRPSEVEANAARIVACVNACEGIPNPSAISEVVETAKDALRSLLKLADPRDEAWDRAARLVAALAKLEGRSND